MATIKIKITQTTRAKLEKDGYKLPAVYESSISDESRFECPLYVNGSVIYGSRLEVGAFTSVAGAKFGNTTVGRYCAFGEQVAIGQHEHPTDWITSSRISHVPNMHDWQSILSRQRPERREFERTVYKSSNPTTEIGNDVWIGFGAYVKAGVKIGNGAIVAARSVVVKDVPPYSIVGGVPAKIIKMRFSDDIIAKCQEVRWWEYCLLDIDADLSNPIIALNRLEELKASNKIEPYYGDTKTPMDFIGDHSSE